MTGGYGHRGGRSRNQTGGGQDISRDPPSVQCNPDRFSGPVDRIAPATVEHATPRCAPSAQGQRFSDRYKVYHLAEFLSCTDPDQGKGGSILPTSADPDGPWSPLSPVGVQALFARACFPWWVAGGHALDLFVGHPTRPHADIDLSVSRSDALRLRRHLAGWDLHLAHAGVLTPWTADRLPTPVTSIWCRTGAEQAWCLQVMFEAGTPTEWVSRRHPDLRCPRADA